MSKDAKIISIIGIITLLILTIGMFTLSKSSLPKAVNPNSLIRSDSPRISSPQAKVDIVEFGDYQCPACKSAQPIIKQVLQDYQGRVNLTFRHFPLPQHPNAIPAAIAAEAAGEQGKYFEMHDLLYETQGEWAENPNPNTFFISLSRKLNLDAAKFEESLKKADTQKIYRDQDDGKNLNLQGTPTFFVNGQQLKDFSYNSFKAAIDQKI